jgi:lactate permease
MNQVGLITITGIAAGIGVISAMLIYLFLRRQPIMDRNKMSLEDISAEKKMSLVAAISPWIILTVVSLIMNAPILPFFDLTFNKYSMAVELIPGAPERLRIFWQAYLWIAVSTIWPSILKAPQSGENI